MIHIIISTVKDIADRKNSVDNLDKMDITRKYRSFNIDFCTKIELNRDVQNCK